MIEALVGLIPLLPLLAACWIGLGRLFGWNLGEAGERHTSQVATTAAGLSLLLLISLALTGAATGQVRVLPWLTSGPFDIWITFTIDRFSLGMATLVDLIAWITLRFAVHYMHREEGFQRFFAVLCLFQAAMLLLVLAGSLMMMFVAWELAGISSWLLIGYGFDRDTATHNANRALVTNRFGDAGFVVAISLSLLWMRGLEWPVIVQQAQKLDTLHVGLVMGGLLLAALAKSAQFPFAAWIHRALEGPTPSSAIFYGSLMIHAGVYLLIRTQALLMEAPVLQILLILLGLLTVVYGVLVGLVQTDIKSAFIFSTQAQVGLMFMACGLGWFELAFWHMMAHAAWRAYPFLHAPSYMHLVVGQPRPVRLLPRSGILYAMAVRRLWLDALAELLIIRPTLALGRDVQTFDDKIVDRLVGQTHDALLDRDEAMGRGMVGRTLEQVADGLHWFEERLLLGSGAGLLQALHFLGRYLDLTDRLLGQPRYLLLLIVLTFVVIL